MQDDNVAIVRAAYEAYGRGDLETMLRFVDPDLEWAYLDPSLEAPSPRSVTVDRTGERARPLGRARVPGRARRDAGEADRVMVCVRTPGIAEQRNREGDDRSYVVLTVRDGRSSRCATAVTETRLALSPASPDPRHVNVG
jgi:ketosteroid isomerase-like protein